MPDTLVNRSMLKPSRIDTPSATKLLALEHNVPLAVSPDSSKELNARAIRLQIKSAQIMDGLQGFLGTGVGAATGVYLISTVVDGMSTEPVVFQGKSYRNIVNGDMLPLGSTPDANAVFNVFLREGTMPRLLSFSLLVLRSNADIRDLAAMFNRIRDDERYKSLSDIVKTAMTAGNPAFGVIWQVSEEIVGLVGEYLQAKPDDQLGYYQANYTNAFDNLGVGRHPDDAPTMAVDRIRFAYEINALPGE